MVVKRFNVFQNKE